MIFPVWLKIFLYSDVSGISQDLFCVTSIRIFNGSLTNIKKIHKTSLRFPKMSWGIPEFYGIHEDMHVETKYIDNSTYLQTIKLQFNWGWDHHFNYYQLSWQIHAWRWVYVWRLKNVVRILLECWQSVRSWLIFAAEALQGRWQCVHWWPEKWIDSWDGQ